MPPKQCPECGRFLRKDLVDSLTEGPRPCPRCDVPLRADMFGDEESVDAPAREEVLGALAELTAADAPIAVPGALRPEPAPEPSPEPEPEREPTSQPAPPVADPLEGWDRGGYEPRTADVVAAEDNTQVLAAGGAAAGALIGLVALGRTRGRGAVLGAVVGALTGAVVGKMTRPTD